MVSTLAKQVAGTYIADGGPPKVPLLAWVQEECRRGSLASALSQFCAQQVESLDPTLTCVDRVNGSVVYGHIPYRSCDHEAPGTFLTETFFEVDLKSKRVRLASGGVV